MTDMMRGGCKEVAKALAERDAANDPNDRITAAERCRREEAVNFARANVELEGFKLTEEVEYLARRFINGEIELKDAMKVVYDSIDKLLSERAGTGPNSSSKQ